MREVRVATILSDESKNKKLDTAKAICTLDAPAGGRRGRGRGRGDNAPQQRLELDLLPTIGEEVVRRRDEPRADAQRARRAPADDALRRGLTIGAMLLRVRLRDARRAPAGDAAARATELPCGGGAADAARLSFELLDFYGGLGDLERRVLRAPSRITRARRGARARR